METKPLNAIIEEDFEIVSKEQTKIVAKFDGFDHGVDLNDFDTIYVSQDDADKTSIARIKAAMESLLHGDLLHMDPQIVKDPTTLEAIGKKFFPVKDEKGLINLYFYEPQYVATVLEEIGTTN